MAARKGREGVAEMALPGRAPPSSSASICVEMQLDHEAMMRGDAAVERVDQLRAAWLSAGPS